MGRFLIIWLFPLCCSAQSSFIQLNDGEEKPFKSVEVMSEKFEKPYLKTDKGEIFHVEQVNAFQNEDGYFLKNDLTANKSDFAERVINGRIQVFRYDLSGNYIQTGQSSSRDYYAYVKYKEPLKQMIYKNLAKDLADNSESMRKLKKVDNAKKITPFYYVLGSACVAGALVSFNLPDNDLSTPLFLGGITFFAIPWILNSKRQKRMDDAVRIYNAG